MKKFCAVLLLIILILSLCGCGKQSETLFNNNFSGEVFSLKLACSMPANSFVGSTVRYLKTTVEEKSNGRLKLELYFDNQLGESSLILSDLQMGTVDLALYNTNDSLDPRFCINAIPYLLENESEIKEYYSPGSKFYTCYSKLFDDIGIRLLGIYVDGYVGISFSEKPASYEKADVMKYIMVRKGPSNVHSYVLDAMKFTSTAVPFDEITRAFYLNAVKGCFGLSATTTDDLLGTTARFWLPINPYVDTLDFTISASTWDSLPDDLRRILSDAVSEACEDQFISVSRFEEASLSSMTDSGTEILPLTENEFNAYKEQIISESWDKLSDYVGRDLFNEVTADFIHTNN